MKVVVRSANERAVKQQAQRGAKGEKCQLSLAGESRNIRRPLALLRAGETPAPQRMLDYEIQRCSRRCSATERELRDGETCYSVLMAEGGQVVRRDFSVEAWQAPPENALGWWKSTVVDPNAGRPHWAPNDVMLSYFERLLEDPTAEDARYVLALLLVRRRVLRVEGHEKDAAGKDTLVLYCGRNESQYRVAEVLPAPERAAAIQQQLAELLQTGQTEGERRA